MTDEEMSDLVHDIAFSYMVYGGFALNILRNKFGQIARIDCLDFRNVRSNKDNTILYYSEDFETKSYGRGKYVAYPCFNKDDVQIASSILYYTGVNYQTYPQPIYGGAIKACELEKDINLFHLNSIENGFMTSALISLNNGVPNDEQKMEIEKNFNEKFSGFENAGRIVIAYNDDKEHSAEIQKIETEDYTGRYETLSKRTTTEIFTAFRATPSLFGIPTENNGFSAEQYEQQYALFYKTVISPIQKKIVRVLNSIFNYEIDCLTIVPFNIDFTTEEKIENIQ